MNKLKKILTLMLAFALVLSMTGVLAGCKKTGKTDDGSATGEPTAYTVTVTSMGGLALEGVTVYVYKNSDLKELQDAGMTDANGFVSLTMPQNSNYAIVLSGLPKGYEVSPYYTFNGSSANISLKSSLVTGESLAGAKLGLGDVMYDFSVTTPNGNTVTLSEVLKVKDVVVLNYWYNGCSACMAEFPYIQDAYEMYIDDAAVIAIDPLYDNASTKSFQETYGYTFTMASCPRTWTSAFDVKGGDVDAYPTTVIIDRYGVICLIEEGALVGLRYWTSIFEHFTGDDYKQKLCADGATDLLTPIKPTYTMPGSDEIAGVLNSGDIQVTYRPETDGDSAEYSWPFVIGEKNGESCIYASNQQIEDSFAILYADVTLKAGQGIGFDYLASTEYGADILHVIVNDEPIYSISGTDEVETWKTCYPWVAYEDGTYEVALCYLKDSDTNEGDDTVYIKNLRVVNEDDIDAATYIPKYAATTEDGLDYTYADIYFNEKDGYYHIGSANGPLLLAVLMDYTNFSEEQTIWDIVYNNELIYKGENLYNLMVDYFSYASNSSLSGICTVNKELAEYLQEIAKQVGFDDDENEWLKMCKYYQVYGSNEQLTDPIKGLAPFSAFEATLGKNIESNSFTYRGIIMPRGYLAKFVPTKSGVYRITSRNDSQDGVEGWIFDENREQLYVYEMCERTYSDDKNVSMLFYMEAGKAYFIDIAFWDYYGTGTIYYDIEYVAKTYELFRLASPGYFTYATDESGAMFYTVAGGVDVVLGSDGIYYVDLGKDKNGKQIYGSKLYADFTGVTSLFSHPISTVNAYDENGNLLRDENGQIVKIQGMIDMGGFDFSKSEEDLMILAYMKANNNDVAATREYLKNMWGEEYSQNAELYQIEDVFEGTYHGKGEDKTAEIQAFLDDIITSGSAELRGCVVVTEELAELLQLLMDKYTFAGVDHSWTKLCYYYQYLGPEG